MNYLRLARLRLKSLNSKLKIKDTINGRLYNVLLGIWGGLVSWFKTVILGLLIKADRTNKLGYINSKFRNQNNLRTLLLPRQQLAIAEACLIGVISGLAAVLLKTGVGALGQWRVYTSYHITAWVSLPLIGIGFGLMAGWLVERFAPETSGGGIPQLKAALSLSAQALPARFIALDLRVAVVKMVGAILTLGSGLTLGIQGPIVQIGAAIAAQLSRWVPTSPDHRRQMIAAGAGAGLAAGFNAPLAGVLFVIEELLQDLSNLTLGAAILASFIGASISRLLGGRSLELNLNQIQYQTTFSLQEIPFYLLLGLLAGLFGSLFNNGVLTSLSLYRRLSLSLPLRVALAGLMSGIIIALLPDAFRDNSGLREYLITGEASWKLTALAFVAHFILTLIAAGSGAPGGLFAPSLILGSSLGYLVGVLQHHLLGIGTPLTYGLAGMGAFFCAVTKAPITAIVIVFEMTTEFNLVLPLMITCVVSYLIAEKVAKGSLYTRLLAVNGIDLQKEPTIDGSLRELKATDVMQRRVETLSSQMTMDEAVQAFSRSHHRGFPVVDANGRLVGIVTQTDLALYTERQLPGNIPLARVMTPKPVTVNPEASLADVLYLLNRYQLSRLPVTDGRKLVGIITRSDLIRAEADKLNGAKTEIGPRPEPSYVVYQTRSPAVGKGRLLVPLSNPQTAEALLQIAGAIALERNFELVCIQIVLVPRHSNPAATAVRTAKSRRLLRLAENLGRRLQVSVHTQVRVAHDVANSILESINDQHIDMLLMGWNAEPPGGGRIFGNVVDTIIRQAACDVILVKIGASHTAGQVNPSFCFLPSAFKKWLVPIAGGPNSEHALQLLPALVFLNDSPLIKLCQVFHHSRLLPDTTILERSAHFLSRELNASVMAVPVRAGSVSDAVINLAQTEKSDVVVLGASREGLLEQAIKGNIPEAIARGVTSTVILVRSAAK